MLIEADRAFPLVSGSSEGPDEPTILLFHRSLRAWVDAGVTVVVDGSLPGDDPALVRECLAEFPVGRTYVVGVRCGLAELERREKVRPEKRLARWAQQQLLAGQDVPTMATVDTTDGASISHALTVLSALRSAGAPV